MQNREEIKTENDKRWNETYIVYDALCIKSLLAGSLFFVEFIFKVYVCAWTYSEIELFEVGSMFIGRNEIKLNFFDKTIELF